MFDTHLRCEICQQRLYEGTESLKLNCGHIFDNDCLIAWMTRNDKCPTCHKHFDSMIKNN